MSRPTAPESGIPVKMIVRSSDGRDAEARAISDRLQGEIGQFLFSARNVLQQQPSGALIRSIAGGTIRFVKNNGQEQLIVTLPPPGSPQPEALPEAAIPEPPPGNDRGWCILDFVVLGEGTSAEFTHFIGYPENYAGFPLNVNNQGEVEFDGPPSYGTPFLHSPTKPQDAMLLRNARYEDLEGAPLDIQTRVSSVRINMSDVEFSSEDPQYVGNLIVLFCYARLRAPLGSAQVDILAGFFDKGSELVARATEHPDGAGIWTVDGETTGREKIGESTIYSGVRSFGYSVGPDPNDFSDNALFHNVFIDVVIDTEAKTVTFRDYTLDDAPLDIP